MHRLRLLHDRLSVQRAEVRHEDASRLQVHALRRSRGGGAAAGVRQGVSRRAACSSGPRTTCWRSPNQRVDQLKANGFPQAAVYDPPGVGGTAVVTVLAFGDRPELYGLPRNPTVPRAVRLWKGPLKWVGNLAMIGGLFGAAVHYIRFGRKHDEGRSRDGRSTGRHDRALPLCRTDDAFRARAVSYVYLLLSGLAFWTPAFYWIAIVLGGGFLTRLLHPWVGLVFAAVSRGCS